MIGQIVGNYKIIDRLGEGGMGAVYKAIDLMVEREVAVKVLRPELARDPDVVERFRREAAVLARLSHPNIATLYSFFRQGDDLFMVMEYLRGETLDALIRKAGSIPHEKAIPLFGQILEGMAHAHVQGIVHRDIKPANLMRTDAGMIKIMDFGIARLLGRGGTTRKGNIIGTIEYMSPEHIRGHETDARSDIYSLAILLYEMLTGHLPFTAGNDFELMRRQIEDEPLTPRVLQPHIPNHIEGIIMKGLSKDPKARPQTADEFRLALLGADSDSLRLRPAEQRQIPVTRVAPVQTSKGLFQEGQIIRGTYEIERFLGEGAFAEVYRVKHRFFGRQAIKVLKTSSVTLEETEALLSEAVLLSRIGHPNIIRVFHADLADTQEGVRAFFTMEYVAGGSLERFWKSHGSRLMPVGTAVDLVMQTCRGLSVAHCENPPIIHRDIKPQNILVGHDAKGLRVWLTDFGLAKRVNPLTLLASSRGTLCFKAPEALLGGIDSCAGDVWALGTTLYLLLTDRLPFPQEVDDGRMDDPLRFNDPVAPPSRFNVDVNDQLDTITLAALAIDPKDRYRSAVEMLSALEAWDPGFGPGQEVTLASSGITLPETIGPTVDLSDRRTAAQKMIADALRKAESGSQLQEAAELLDKALRQCPELRSEYVYRLSLWRKGLTM